MTALEPGRWRGKLARPEMVSTPSQLGVPPAGLPWGRVSVEQLLYLIGGFIAVLACVALARSLQSDDPAALALSAPVGASAVLVFAGPRSPFSHPRNLALGYLIAALVVVAVRPALGSHLALASALCVLVTSMLMQFSHSIHPPAGGFALIPIVGATSVRSAPAWSIVATAMVGVLVILLVQLGVHGLKSVLRRLLPATGSR